jgi:hypothetical protein
MKTIAQKYHETRAQAQRCKPRSERKMLLTRRMRDLLTRQLRKEVRNARA